MIHLKVDLDTNALRVLKEAGMRWEGVHFNALMDRTAWFLGCKNIPDVLPEGATCLWRTLEQIRPLLDNDTYLNVKMFGDMR
jgi:hypothetical protein